MEGYTLSEGGILRPMFPEEMAFMKDIALSAPVVASDFLSSISQIISPRRKDEIVGLAELILQEFEEHVDTRIRRSPEVRVHRDAEEFPHRQLHITVELAYAYQLLNIFDPERFGQEYSDESQRLRAEVDRKTEQFVRMPTIGFTAMLRMATLNYFGAALTHIYFEDGKIPHDKSEECEKHIEVEARKALCLYQEAGDIAEKFSVGDAQVKSMRARLAQTESLEAAMKIFEEGTNIFTNSKNPVEMGALREHYEWLMQGMYEQHTEDILFGKMRCNALLGDYDKLIETADNLETFQTSGKYNPSRLIRESAEIIRQKALSNQAEGSKKPFVADSLEEHAEYARSLVLERKIRHPISAEQELRWVIDNS